MRSRFFLFLMTVISVSVLSFLPFSPGLSVARAEPPKKSSAPKKVDVPPELAAQVYVETMQMSEQLLSDYRQVLEVYYELKKHSAHPGEFPNYSYDPKLAASLPETVRGMFEAKSIKTVQEFDFEMYKEFQAQIDAHPALKNNTYLQRMREYGSGRANDVFQRVGSYALEKAEFKGLTESLHAAAYRYVASPVMALSMHRSKAVFVEVSKSHGYPANGADQGPIDIESWQETVGKIEKDLEPQLKKMNFHTQLSGSCPAAFGKLAK